MTQKTIRPLKVRALEKLQQILKRGWRDGAKGCDHMFWRDGLAVLRSAYDLGATKPGSIVLTLGDHNRIVGVSYDDAGPAWDCNDENSKHWADINTWATGIVKVGAYDVIKPNPAEFFAGGLWNAKNLSAKSHVLMRDMAMEQWESREGLKAVVQRLLPPSLTPEQWHANALYLSETLVADKQGPLFNFEYKGVFFNSKYMLPWLLLATLSLDAQYNKSSNVTSDALSVTQYTTAMALRRDERTETQYDWRVYNDANGPLRAFSSPLYVRVVLEPKFGLFNHVRMGPDVLKMHARERAECIKQIYDVFQGHEPALTPEQSHPWNCAQLVALKSSGSIETMDGTAIKRVLHVLSDEWWACPGSQGNAMLTTLESLYQWSDMTRSSPRAALALLADMAALAAPKELEYEPIKGDVFEPS